MGAGPKCIRPVALIVTESPRRKTTPVAVQVWSARSDTFVTVVADAAGDAARTAAVISTDAMQTATGRVDRL